MAPPGKVWLAQPLYTSA
uniref:Uncharacterized protein n=1 Tax=Arundo donax TaxID=35708 RepID=A0A0A9ECJ4_ARUDO